MAKGSGQFSYQGRIKTTSGEETMIKYFCDHCGKEIRKLDSERYIGDLKPF